MHRNSVLWKANTIVFISSFCVMVIELIAARVMAPSIGVSLYTWTSIIGVILAGIALGNYTGGKIADKHPSPLVLVGIFFLGSLLTVAIMPIAKTLSAHGDWFVTWPLMMNFTLRTLIIFFLPAFVLSIEVVPISWTE
jgi:predicted membrane-bound spermidine synthase